MEKSANEIHNNAYEAGYNNGFIKGRTYEIKQTIAMLDSISKYTTVVDSSAKSVTIYKEN